MLRSSLITLLIALSLLLPALDALSQEHNGYPAFVGASLDWATFPFGEMRPWNSGGREEFIYYLDEKCPELGIHSIRILLWPEAFPGQLGTMLVEFNDILAARNMTCLYWIATYVPSQFGIQTLEDIANNQAQYDQIVDQGKLRIWETIGHLARNRPRSKAVLGWSIGDGEAPWSLANMEYFKTLAAYTRAQDPYHPVGKEFYNSTVRYGQIVGLPDNNGDTLLAQRNVYDHVDYIGYAVYHLWDGASAQPLGFAESIKQINLQNPDNKPIILEEYGFTMDNDPRSTFDTEIVNRAYLQGDNYMGSYFWTLHANFNPDSTENIGYDLPGYASYFFDDARPYNIGDTKNWAKVFAIQNQTQPLASFTFMDRYSDSEAWDYSDGENILQLVNGATKQAGGKTGRALSLIKSASQYGNFSGPNLERIFFKAWVKPGSFSWPADTLLGRPGAIQVSIGGNGLIYVWADVGHGWSSQATGTIPLTTDVWSKVAVSYDGTFWRIYVDDTLDVEVESPGAIVEKDEDYFIGSYDGSREFLDGQIDEIILVPESPLLAGWSMDGNARQDRTPVTGLDLQYSGFSGNFVPGVQSSVGQALRFDGVDDMATVDASSLRSNAITVDLYFAAYRPHNGVGQTLLSCGQGELGDYGSGWNIFLKSQKVYFTINLNDSDDGAEIELVHPDTIEISEQGSLQWYHVRAAYCGKKAILYVDGDPVEVTTEGKIEYRDSEALTFGQFSTGGSETDYFDGLLDEVKVYPVGLLQQPSSVPGFQLY